MTTAASASGIVQGAIPASRRPDGTVRKEIKVRPGFTPQEDIPRFRSPRVLEKLKGSASSAVSSPSSPATTITSDAFSTASLVSSLDAINVSSSTSIDSPSVKRGSSASVHAPPSASSLLSAPASTTGFKSGAAASMHAPVGKKTGSSASMHAPSSQPPVVTLASVQQDSSSPVSSTPSAPTSVSTPASTTNPSSTSSQGPPSHSGHQDRTGEPPRSSPRKPWPSGQTTGSNDSAESKPETKPESSSAEVSNKTPEVTVSSSSSSKLAMDQPLSTFASSQAEVPPATAYRSSRILDSKSNQVDRSTRHNIDSDWNAAKHCFLDEDDYEDKRSRKGGRKGKNAKKGKGSSKTAAGKGVEAMGIPIIQSDHLGSNATFVDGSELDEDLQKTFTPSPSLSRVLPPFLSKLDPSKAPFIFPSRPSTPIHSAGPSSPTAEERPNPVVNLPISARLAEKKDQDRDGHGVEGDSWRRRRTDEEDSLFGAGGKGPVDRIVVNLPKGKPGVGGDVVAGAGPASSKEGGAKDKKKKKKKKNAPKTKEDTPGGKGSRGKKEEEPKITTEEQVKQKKEEQNQVERPMILPSFSDDSWGVHLRTQSWADEIDLEEDEPNFG